MPSFDISGPQVVHEIIDGEVVVVNLEQGHYFSSGPVGAWVWQLILLGADPDAISDDAVIRFGDVGEEIRGFIDSLVDHRLIVAATRKPGDPADLELVTPPEAYSTPTLEVFSDMEDLLLLDPIHDVGADEGWPLRGHPVTTDLDPRLDGMRLMQRDADRAADQVRGEGGAVVERSIEIDGAIARFRFAGDASAQPMMDALEHLACAGVEHPDLTVDVWDSASTNAALSPLLRIVVEGAGFETLTPRMELDGLTTEVARTAVIPWDGTTTMYEPSAGHAVYWTPDAAKVPYFERGAPFRTLLNWWLSDRGLQCVHAGAVGTDSGAVLLTGRGGSGKSTAALACLGSDLRYLSDDYCVITPGSGAGSATVHSLYNTAKLDGEEDLRRLPHLRGWIENPDRAHGDKAMMFVHHHAPAELLRRAPLRAIVLPTVTGAAVPTLRPVSGMQALRALAPTSLFQLPGTGQRTLSALAALVRDVPCYRMETGPDLAAIPGVLGELLAG